MYHHVRGRVVGHDRQCQSQYPGQGGIPPDQQRHQFAAMSGGGIPTKEKSDNRNDVQSVVDSPVALASSFVPAAPDYTFAFNFRKRRDCHFVNHLGSRVRAGSVGRLTPVTGRENAAMGEGDFDEEQTDGQCMRMRMGMRIYVTKETSDIHDKLMFMLCFVSELEVVCKGDFKLTGQYICKGDSSCVQAGKAATFDTVNGAVQSVNSDSDASVIPESSTQEVAESSNQGGGDATGHSLVLGSRGERMKAKLMSELSPAELVIEEVSYQHAGVRGTYGETHFNVKVVSGKFEGKNLVKRHRLIYELLQEELQSGLHALSIVAMMPSEVNR
ncbi:hypothetical protein QQ045_002815 [Rhodiola kirilowii]